MNLHAINQDIIQCRKCPRLVEWRERVAAEKTPRFANWEYWGKPVPGFGEVEARLLIIGLAPAAHGANRTGRMFTGDRSGEWLYRALYRAGFASQPVSNSREDGLQLRDGYITALCRCAPPGNKPAPKELANCAPYLAAELDYFLRLWNSLPGGKAILCLGQLSFRHTLEMLERKGWGPFKPRPQFRHGAALPLGGQIRMFASFHPSQQNTFTGKLTGEMWEGVFRGIREWIGG